MNTANRRKSLFLAGIIALAVTLWMLSGFGTGPTDTASLDLNGGGQSSQALQVRVQQIRASEIEREIIVSGRTEPNRRVQLRAETDGAVIALHVDRGSRVNTGAEIISLDLRDRDARLREANALVQQRELEYNAAENLRGQRFTSEVEIAEASTRF